MKRNWVLPAIALSMLAGCAPAPKHQRPTVAAPPAFRGGAAGGDATSLADLKWFEVFKDSRLQELIRVALARNYDLQEAAARVDAARAQVGITHADQLPSVEAAGSVTAQRFSANGSFPLPPGIQLRRTVGSVALNLLSYEVDLWGRLRRATDAARANLLASEENRKTVISVLVSDVAAAYFNLLSLDMELEIAQRTLKTRDDSLGLIRKREERGLASKLALRQGEQLVFTARATIPGIEQRIEQTENQLSLLLGGSPEAIPRGLRLAEQEQPTDVPPGLPSTLLARRPDIRAAEQTLAAANAQVDVARKAYFPQISLTSFLGYQSNQLTGLFNGRSNAWQLVPQANLPVFTGGRLRSNTDFARAQERLAIIDYERTVQTAFREVSDALVAHQKARETRTEQERLVETLRDRSRLSYLRYQRGVDTLLDALDSDRDLFGAELSLAQAKRDHLLALVQLYRALGGGWQ